MFKVPIAKTPRFRVEAQIKPHSKTLLLQFVGDISEESDFTAIADYVFGMGQDIKSIDLDLQAVTRINSVGVMHWISFLGRVQSRIRCTFDVLGPVMIDQAAKVSTFLGRPGTPVTAVALPYSCQKCGTTTERIVGTDTFLAARTFSPPRLKCEDCSADLEFDDMPESYEALMTHLLR